MQSFLELHKRPVVQFDPANPEHRHQAAMFLKHGTWGKCPWAFYAPDNLSIKAYAMQTMVEYYLKKEFADDPYFLYYEFCGKNTLKLDSQKIKKTIFETWQIYASRILDCLV